MNENYEYTYDQAAQEDVSQGCLSIFSLPILGSVLVGIILLVIFNWLASQPFLFNQPSERIVDSQVQGSGTGKQRNPVDGQISQVFTPEVQRWGSKIITWSKRWDVDPQLIATVMQIESCGHPTIHSSAGAIGLFQVMPYHFGEDEEPTTPGINALRGIGYLKSALNAFDGDARMALAGYNGGINGAKRGEQNWADETVRYVYYGLGIYQDAVSNNLTSGRLDEWLSNGGASLCRKASSELGLASK